MPSQPPQRKPLQPRPDSLQSLLSAVQSRLQSADVADAGLEASILVEHATGLDRTLLLRDIQRPASTFESGAVDELVDRRLAGEPVQYIVGRAWFYGREFDVDRRVLIPRPETEGLVVAALELLAGRIEGSTRPNICDVGTGSGILAITLALECPEAHVVATDLSAGALDVACRNCVRHEVGDRVQLVQCDGLAGVSQKVDIVVSNPPYIRSGDIQALQSEVRDFEPHMALDGGPDGLDMLRSLIAECAEHVVAGGTALLEVGSGQADEVCDLMTDTGLWTEVKVQADLSGVDRVVCGRRRAP